MAGARMVEGGEARWVVKRRQRTQGLVLGEDKKGGRRGGGGDTLTGESG